jgi:phosphonoacetaldehyde hydrolase
MPVRDRFDMVVLDWAGTVVDFGCQAPMMALREAFARRGVGITDPQARRDMGKAKEDHVRALLANPDVAKAWVAARGSQSGDADVAGLMEDLGPLMRDQAGRAARLIDGAKATIDELRRQGIKIASSTGYTRDMMQPVLREAAQQGYSPDHLVCSGETLAGRPSPLMIYKACLDLGVWPLSRVVKVDDTEAGVSEGRNAGCFTVGLAASGNSVGLTQEALAALSPADRAQKLAAAKKCLLAAGADVVIDSIADLNSVIDD